MRSVISRRASGGWSPTCARASRFTARITDRGQRQHGRHLGDRRPAGPRAARGARRAHGAAWTRPGAAGHLVAERGRRPRLHGCRSVDRPERAAPAGRPAAVRAQRPGHRHPARPRLPGHPRSQAGAHLARLQPTAADPDGGALLRRAVRLQGDQARPGAGAAPAHQGHRLVLRHRTARAGRTRRAADPRGPGGLDRRPRLARRHHRHRPGRPARHGQARGRLRARLHPGPAAARAGPGRRGRRRRRPGACRCRSPGSRSSAWPARSPTWRCSCCCGWRCRPRRRTCSACC